jgi:hypothetical protein
VHRVELPGLGLGESHDPRGTHPKAGALEVGDDVAGFGTAEGVGLDDREREVPSHCSFRVR